MKQDPSVDHQANVRLVFSQAVKKKESVYQFGVSDQKIVENGMSYLKYVFQCFLKGGKAIENIQW